MEPMLSPIEAAQSLQSDLLDDVKLLEQVDNLMPSTPMEKKLSVDDDIREQFYSMAYNPIEFLDRRLPKYQTQIQIIASDPEIYREYGQLNDGIAIMSCKVLQFEIGRIAQFIKQRDYRLDEDGIQKNLASLKEVKRILYALGELDNSEIAIAEVRKTDRLVIEIYNKLTSKTILSSLKKMFR